MYNLTGKIYFESKNKLNVFDILNEYDIPEAWMKVHDDYIECRAYEHDSSFVLDNINDCLTDLMQYVTKSSNLILTDEYDNFIEFWSIANSEKERLMLSIENETNLLQNKLETLKYLCSQSEEKINYIDIVQKLLLEIE